MVRWVLMAPVADWKIDAMMAIIRTSRATVTSISTSVTPRRAGGVGRVRGVRIGGSLQLQGGGAVAPHEPGDREGDGEAVDDVGRHQGRVQVDRHGRVGGGAPG